MILSKKATCLLYLIGSILTHKSNATAANAQLLQSHIACRPQAWHSALSSSHVVLSHLHACTRATPLHLAMPQLPMYVRVCTSEMKQNTHDTSPTVCLYSITCMLAIARHVSHSYISAQNTTYLHYASCIIPRERHSAAILDSQYKTAALTK